MAKRNRTQAENKKQQPQTGNEQMRQAQPQNRFSNQQSNKQQQHENEYK